MRATLLWIPTPTLLPHKNHLFMSCRYHNEYWIYRTLSCDCEYILWSKFRITLDGPPLKPFIFSKWVGGHLEILVSARVVMICYWLPTCASQIPSIVCYRGIAMRLKETRNVYYKHPQFEFNSLVEGSSIIALSKGVSWFLHHQRRLNFIFVKSPSTFVTSLKMWINIPGKKFLLHLFGHFLNISNLTFFSWSSSLQLVHWLFLSSCKPPRSQGEAH